MMNELGGIETVDVINEDVEIDNVLQLRTMEITHRMIYIRRVTSPD